MKTGLYQRGLTSTRTQASSKRKAKQSQTLHHPLWRLKSLNVPGIRVKHATKMWPIRAVWPVRQPIRVGCAWTRTNHIETHCSSGHWWVGEGSVACSWRKEKCERDVGWKHRVKVREEEVKGEEREKLFVFLLKYRIELKYMINETISKTRPTTFPTISL